MRRALHSAFILLAALLLPSLTVLGADDKTEARVAAMTPADVDAQMEAYVEKMFGDIKKTTKYSDLVVWLDNYANILAGKQSMADRSPESMFGREVLNVGTG